MSDFVVSRRWRLWRPRRPLALAMPIVLAAGALAGGVAPPAQPALAALASTPHYNLSVALQQSLYFYDAEKSGPSRTLGKQPLEWRGDSDPTDSKVPLKPIKNWEGTNLSASFISANKAILDPDGDGTVDLSGGFHDAGDHVKFGLPQAYAAGTIGWGMVEFKDAFVATKSWDHAMEEMRWFTDYFLRSLFTDKAGNVVAFNYQVGDGSVDHAYWGPPELQDPKLYQRPAYFATSETPASDQTASHAAALAIMYLLVKDTDPAYAKRCLDAAKALYAHAVKYRGLGYSGGFYGSSFDEDEMSWGAAWLYKATNDHTYLDHILSIDSKGTYNGYLKTLIGNNTNTWVNIWVHSWDTKWGGVFSILDPLVQADTKLPEKVRNDVHFWDKWHVEFWSHVPHDLASDTTFLATSPGGLAWLNGWGSARYNTAGQLTALAYRNHFPDDPKSVKFSDWAMGQMNYIMGDNPLSRSYIVGFGSDAPGGVGKLVGGKAKMARHPHHAAAHGSTTNNQDDPPENAHTLWGGLVGGPDMKDEHKDIVSDYVYNEVAVDYNAAMVGALAGLWKYYGDGQENSVFTPPLEEKTIDYYAFGKVVQATARASQVSVTVNNFDLRPPHYQTNLSARYYFNIKELYKRGQDISAVSTEIYYDAGAANRNQPAKVSKPVRWGGEKSCVYYVTLDWAGADVFGASELQFGLIAAQDKEYKTWWDPSNDYSYTGMTDGTYAKTKDPYVPVYVGGKLYYGDEPPTTLDETCAGEPEDPGTGTPTVTAQYSISKQSAAERIANTLQVTNTGTSVVDLSKVTVRYWFTSESTGTLTYACDYAPIDCANVKGGFGTVSPAAKGADRYLELSFAAKAGKLYPGNTTGPIQNRIQSPEGATFDQADDYSYDAKATSLADSTRIAVYYQGKLIYGTPPS